MISFVGAGALAASATTGPVTAAFPAGTAVGDVIYCHAYSYVQGTINTPSGWTLLRSANVSGGGTAAVFRRVGQSGDTSPSVSGGGGSGLYAVCSAYRGADTTNPEDVTPPTGSTGNSTSVSAPSVTTATNGSWAIWFHAQGDNNALGSPTNSPTGTAYSGSDYATITGGDVGMASAYKLIPTAGASGTCVMTATGGQVNTQWVGLTVALRDAPTGDTADAADTFTAGEATAFGDTLTLADAVIAADAVDVSDAENVSWADSATLVDSVDIFDITTELTALVDTATVGEAVTTADSLAAADAAAATDSVAVTDSLNPTDSLSAADAVTIQDTQFLTPTDTASTDTALDILDVPSAMLGAVDYGPAYDLVVVAAIPRQSGPPAFQELDPIEWDSLKWADILSAPQELSATAPLTRLPPTVLQRLERPHAHPTELWLWRDGRLVAAGPLVGWTKDSDTVTVKAAGILAYCDAMFVQNDLRFDQVDQFTIARNLIDQWQTSDYGHCGIDTSAVGESGVLRDATYARTEIHRVGQRVNELGRRRDGFDAEVDPVTRRLQLWHPGKGVNRSQGEDAIVIDERSITSGQVACSVSPGDLATEGFGAGSAAGAASALWSHQSNADLRATYGRRGVAGTWSDVSEQATLDAHVQGMLDARSEALLIPGPGLRVTPDADLAAYEVGDTILYDESHALLGVTGAFRIRKREVSVAENGMQETVAVEFV